MVSDINIQARYSSMPLIDSFRIFEGTSETERISHKIEMVLVPEEFEKRFVEDMVSREPASSGLVGPRYYCFPHKRPSRTP